MSGDSALDKLFGSSSRVKILKLLLDNEGKQFRVNEIIRKSGVNARLASTELKKLAEIRLLTAQPSGNSLFYGVNANSAFANPLKEILAEHEWYEWERPSRIHHLIFSLQGGLVPMEDYFGVCIPEAHLVFNYDNVIWFFKLRSFLKVGKELVEIYKKRKNQIWEDFEKVSSTLWTHKDYPSFYKNYIDFWKIGWISDCISMYLDTFLKSGECLVAREKSFTDQYEDRLWDLAKKAQKEGLESLNVQSVLDDYFWIRNSYLGIHRITKDEILTEVKKRLGKKRAQPQPVSDPKSLPSDLIEVGKDMIHFQDVRKMRMMKAAYYLHEFLKNIGSRYDLSPTLMDQSLPSEILNISHKMPGLAEELRLRQRCCTIVTKPSGELQVYSGQMIFPVGVERRSKFEIRGNVACGGKAIGRVKIVSGIGDISKVNHGDVIVSPMTTPDLMPAIRRCVAIVTNFGGVTCHAAIVAREFNIPCIVGTNNATELLRDEDLVEVDADNGLVRVLQGGS